MTGVHVSPGPKGLVLGWSAAFWLSLCFIIRPQCRWARRVLAAGNGLLLLSVIGVTGALLSYYTVRVSPFPLADTVLYRADLTIGLDWLAVYRSYAGFSPVHLLANRLYLTIFDTPYVIVIGLAAAGRDDKLLTFIGAFAIGLLLTILVSFFLPAASPVIHFFGSSPPYVPTTGTGYYPVLTELRSQRIMHVASHELFGLLTFPSFHAVSAVLFAWAGWSLRYLRWPVLAVNAGMLVVTPLEGSHYFVDLIAGCLVALAAIVLVETCARQARQRRSQALLPVPTAAMAGLEPYRALAE
ncbi:phosphatase PAP2 family protein [Novosphingobium panipatense]|nr:phosphatase PAP2 family protein [Novosphingobium panipatense]